MTATYGVDLGGTKLLAGLVEEDGTIVRSERRIINGLPFDKLLETVDEALRALGHDGVSPVGFGIPALIDQARGVAVRCVHLPLDDVPFRDVMTQRLGVPVSVDNDGNCAVLAEWRAGAAKGHDDVALLTLGTGIGGGLVLGGELYRGAIGAGAELGHMPIDLDGPPCFGGCPGRGCMEALCSGSALARDARERASLVPNSRLGREFAAGVALTGEHVTALAREGDPDARGLLHALGTRLGVGITGIAMALNPSVVVVGGGVLAAGEMLLAPARAEVARRAMEPSRTLEIVHTHFEDRAGMVGAAFSVAPSVARPGGGAGTRGRA